MPSWLTALLRDFPTLPRKPTSGPVYSTMIQQSSRKYSATPIYTAILTRYFFIQHTRVPCRHYPILDWMLRPLDLQCPLW